jgi:hypothetical protein
MARNEPKPRGEEGVAVVGEEAVEEVEVANSNGERILFLLFCFFSLGSTCSFAEPISSFPAHLEVFPDDRHFLDGEKRDN